MIELYRPPECPVCAEIEAALKEMVIAHKVIVIEPGGPAAETAPAISLPALKENDRVISGQAAITAYLKELSAPFNFPEAQKWPHNTPTLPSQEHFCLRLRA